MHKGIRQPCAPNDQQMLIKIKHLEPRVWLAVVKEMPVHSQAKYYSTYSHLTVEKKLLLFTAGILFYKEQTAAHQSSSPQPRGKVWTGLKRAPIVTSPGAEDNG